MSDKQRADRAKAQAAADARITARIREAEAARRAAAQARECRECGDPVPAQDPDGEDDYFLGYGFCCWGCHWEFVARKAYERGRGWRHACDECGAVYHGLGGQRFSRTCSRGCREAQSEKGKEFRCLRKQMSALRKFARTQDPAAFRSLPEGYGPPPTSPS